MLTLACGLNPQALGTFPYTVELASHASRNADDLGLGIAGRGRVYLPPVLSAYVGADIVSGIIAADLVALEGITLFVDIGTNGEMVLAVDGRLTATSTAAGPAFEGMNISCGMRASRGAIELVQIDDAVSLGVLGGAEPIGLCGSGLLDAVGELARRGAVSPGGRFQPGAVDPALGAFFDTVDGKTVFRLAPRVWLTQKDIRQVQLAKGAVRAGIEFLLASQNVTADRVDRVLIAGSFGYHLRAESLLNLGLLPPEFEGRIEFLGNTSQSGGRALLVNAELRQRAAALAGVTQVLELSRFPAFERTFVRCLELKR